MICFSMPSSLVGSYNSVQFSLFSAKSSDSYTGPPLIHIQRTYDTENGQRERKTVRWSRAIGVHRWEEDDDEEDGDR